MKATPRMLSRTVLPFAGGNGSVAGPLVIRGFKVGIGTASLPLVSLGLDPLSAKPSCENERTRELLLIHTSCQRMLYFLEQSRWPLGQCQSALGKSEFSSLVESRTPGWYCQRLRVL